jgi:osmotically-inducible protein OsmY
MGTGMNAANKFDQNGGSLVRSDQEIKSDVKDALTWDMRVDNQNINANVYDGIVTLTGTVDTYYQKLEAAQIVGRIKGVVDVINEISVKLATTRSDLDIRSDIYSALNRDSTLDPTNVTVSVHNGIVDLNGSVASVAQKNAAGSDAWLTTGVIDVNNNLVIEPAFIRTDHEVKDAVIARLLSDTVIYVRGLNVDVVNGTVYLRGTVNGYTQKMEAGDDAWSVPGVRGVVNELSVEIAA